MNFPGKAPGFEDLKQKVEQKVKYSEALKADRKFVSEEFSKLVKDFESQIQTIVSKLGSELSLDSSLLRFNRSHEGHGSVYFLYGTLNYDFDKQKLAVELELKKEQNSSKKVFFYARQQELVSRPTATGSSQVTSIVWTEDVHSADCSFSASELAVSATDWLVESQTSK